jgi:hypothetical protein
MDTTIASHDLSGSHASLTLPPAIGGPKQIWLIPKLRQRSTTTLRHHLFPRQLNYYILI